MSAHTEPVSTPLTQKDIEVGLRLVLGRGDAVEVHSSLSSFGWVEGGAPAVVDALMNVVGENGALVMSAYPVSLPLPPTEQEKGRGILGKVRIFGDEFTVNAQIAMANGFSAHADHSELIDWVNEVKGSLKGVFVVHGEPESSQAFAADLRTMGSFNVTVPALNQTIQV